MKQAYVKPRLVCHGSLKALTQAVSGANGLP
jgi:hypothetical protein